MKKNEIAMVRLLSLAILMGLSFFLLLIPIGGNEFNSIINKMNTNIYDIAGSQSSIYNLYFYMGLGEVYKILYSVTILLTAMSAVSIILRIGNAGRVASAGAVMTFVTGTFLLLARIWESSVSMHALIDSFYMDDVVKSQIETTRHLDKVPVIYILLMLIGILSVFMIRSSRILHVKIYRKKEDSDAVVMLIPALCIYVFAGFMRMNIVSFVVNGGDVNRIAAYEYLRDYYIGNKFFFNWSWMIMLLLVTVLCIIVNTRVKGSGALKPIICVGVPSLVTIIPTVIYAFNPPALFGYLTLDISLCDMTDNAFYAYLAAFCVAMITGYILIYLVINGHLKIKAFGMILLTDIVISILLALISSGKDSLAIQYMPWIAGDIISVVMCGIVIAFSRQKPENAR